MTELHILPVGAESRHEASASCPCSPVRTYRNLSTGEAVWRHRDPEQRTRTQPTSGQRYPIPPDAALPPALRETLEAVRGGARTPGEIAACLGIDPFAARSRLTRLRDLDLIHESREP